MRGCSEEDMEAEVRGIERKERERKGGGEKG